MTYNRLSINVLANYVGQIYSMLIGVVVLPFLYKYLGAEAYGLIGFYVMIQSWMVLLDSGLSVTLSRETARLNVLENGLHRIKLTLRSIEGFYLIIVTVAILLFYSLSGVIATRWLTIEKLSINKVITCIQIVGVIISMRWFSSLYQGSLIGFEKQLWVNVYKVVTNTLRFVGAFFVVKYINNDILLYFKYQFLCSIVEYILIRRKIYSILPKTEFLWPSVKLLKEIAPFCLSIAYTSGIWLLFTQTDKLMLSSYLPLGKYGFYSIVISIATVVTQFATPLTQGLLPRMTNLYALGKKDDMMAIYHKGTQFMAIMVCTVCGMIVTYPKEILFMFTGDHAVADWGSTILQLYVLGNGFMALLSFQYYLQYVHGIMKYHVWFNTVFPLVSLPIIYFSINKFGAIGAASAWCGIQIAIFAFWPGVIHRIFAKNHHVRWITQDILPSVLFTFSIMLMLNFTSHGFFTGGRVNIFIMLSITTAIVMLLNLMLYRFTREALLSKFSTVFNRFSSFK